MRDRADTESERTSFGMGVVAVAVGVGYAVADSIARRRARPAGHREVEPARIDTPSFEFEDELERLLASAGRPRVHA